LTPVVDPEPKAGIQESWSALRFSWVDAAPALFLLILPLAHTTPLRIACLVLSAVAAAVATRRRLSAGRPTRSLAIAVGFWFCVCLAACFTSIEPIYSWGEFRNEVLSTVAAFIVFWLLTDDADAMRRWSAALLASFVVVAPIATASYLFGGDWTRGGLTGDRNAYSTYVVLIVPFLCYRWFAAAGRARGWRIGFALAIALALVSGSLTQNRNLWFAVAVEACCFAMLVWFRQPPEARRGLRRRYLTAGILGVVVFVGALAFVVQQKALVSGTSTEEQARFDRDPRLEIWRYAGERIRERPWFGHGYGRGILRADFRTHFDNPLKWHGHNLVVDYALEAGVVGVVAIVGLLLALFVHAWRIYRSDDPSLWPLGAWVLTMLVGVLIKVMTDDILVRESSLLFWSVLGIVFGQASRAKASAA
jgi:O-antigen ligase